ncbi:MAG: hypothetical protein IMW89_13550 [Ktedonobacteraceae bacterium]|nr:hypothetical protein [Ktedonobacteraceae bacterium]
MAKLQELFTQARRTQSRGGIGFLGRSGNESRAHAAALVVAFPQITTGAAESALKAGADGLLFHWDGTNSETPAAVKNEIESARSVNDAVITGVRVTGGWESFGKEHFASLKDAGVHYIILPFNAPVRLLAMNEKEIEKVVTIPMHENDLSQIFLRSLTALEGASAVVLDFGLTHNLGSLTIEEALRYRTVREATRLPAFIEVSGDLSLDEAYTLRALGVQALLLNASSDEEATRQQVKALRELLEKLYQEEKESEPVKIKP